MIFFLSTIIFTSRKWVLEIIWIIFILNLGFTIVPGMQTQLMLSEHISKAFSLNTMHSHSTESTQGCLHSQDAPLLSHKLVTISQHWQSAVWNVTSLCPIYNQHSCHVILQTHFLRNASVERGFPCYAFYSPLWDVLLHPPQASEAPAQTQWWGGRDERVGGLHRCSPTEVTFLVPRHVG